MCTVKSSNVLVMGTFFAAIATCKSYHLDKTLYTKKLLVHI